MHLSLQLIHMTYLRKLKKRAFFTICDDFLARCSVKMVGQIGKLN
jgi:hypothetical protein